MSDTDRTTLILRYADVGIATYASLRIVGQPSRTVNWVVASRCCSPRWKNWRTPCPSRTAPRAGGTPSSAR